jgi:prolipoprotein diacylglyceryltransferase
MGIYLKTNARNRPGLLLGLFFVMIFTPRFFIEFVKEDQEAFEAGMMLNMGQWLSIPFILGGIGFAWRALKKPEVIFKNQ